MNHFLRHFLPNFGIVIIEMANNGPFFTGIVWRKLSSFSHHILHTDNIGDRIGQPLAAARHRSRMEVLFILASSQRKRESIEINFQWSLSHVCSLCGLGFVTAVAIAFGQNEMIDRFQSNRDPILISLWISIDRMFHIKANWNSNEENKSGERNAWSSRSI